MPPGRSRQILTFIPNRSDQKPTSINVELMTIFPLKVPMLRDSPNIAPSHAFLWEDFSSARRPGVATTDRSTRSVERTNPNRAQSADIERLGIVQQRDHEGMPCPGFPLHSARNSALRVLLQKLLLLCDAEFLR